MKKLLILYNIYFSMQILEHNYTGGQDKGSDVCTIQTIQGRHSDKARKYRCTVAATLML